MTPLVRHDREHRLATWPFTLNSGTFSYGIVIDPVISFVLIAAVVFFLIVKPMQVLAARRSQGKSKPTNRPQKRCC
ncbi:MAG: MscL family protein [Microthrixaceae bacterium]|nr:MscL family protein [Microthrixaceae bacterium]